LQCSLSSSSCVGCFSFRFIQSKEGSISCYTWGSVVGQGIINWFERQYRFIKMCMLVLLGEGLLCLSPYFKMRGRVQWSSTVLLVEVHPSQNSCCSRG
jgi:hypothetical protein